MLTASRIEEMADDGTGLTRLFGIVTVRLVHDDIASRKVDVLVNAANDQLVMGGGVAAALRSRGGIEIHQEAIAQAPKPLGSVVRTGAGQLPAQWVYHAVVIRFDLAGGTSVSDVPVAVKGVLELARQDGVNSLAMPLFGAGVGGLTVQQSLEAVLDAIEEGAPGFGRDLAVEIVIRDDEEFEQAREVFRGFKNRASRAKEEDDLAREFLENLLRGR